MTAHIVYDALDPDAPATLSPEMIRLIREEIGFAGLLMTDDLSMGRCPGPIAARAARRDRGGLRPDPALQRRAGRDGGRLPPRRHAGRRDAARARPRRLAAARARPSRLTSPRRGRPFRPSGSGQVHG
jgi:beta-N-acetylhexosaminidase